MARNHLEERLEAIRNETSMLRWKQVVIDDVVEIEMIDDKLDELHNEELKILRDLGVELIWVKVTDTSI